MHALPSLAWRLLALLACLFAATSALAQGGSDRGDWQILEARYGTTERNVDVTQRLREVARRDTSFRITNDLFGSDPHPGAVKTLRIYARSGSGATHTFEYPENAVAQGTMFVGWSEGNWGQGGWGGGWGDAGSQGGGDAGQWQILQARYGSTQRNVDVTARMRELARRESAFRVTNETFGTDPHPNVAKTLRIYARNTSGATRTFEYGEEQMVNGAIFTAWSGGNWGQGNWEGGWGHYRAAGWPTAASASSARSTARGRIAPTSPRGCARWCATAASPPASPTTRWGPTPRPTGRRSSGWRITSAARGNARPRSTKGRN